MRRFGVFIIGLLWCISSRLYAYDYIANYYAVYEAPASGGGVVVYIVPKLSILIVAGEIDTPIAFMPNLPGLSALLASNGTLGAFSPVNYTARDMAALGATASGYKLYGGDFNGDASQDLLLQGVGNRESIVLIANAGGVPATYYSFGTALNSAAVQLVVRDVDGNGRSDVIATGTATSTTYLSSSVGNWFDNVDQVITSTALVGHIAGKFRVDEQGEATYSIAIMAAPGTAGVTPQVSLNYASGGGDGLIGKGWSLGGISSISRCRQTLIQDGRSDGITLGANDRFCLDGQRLILTSGTYGASGATYRTEIDSYATISSQGGSVGNPAYFIVQRKDGSISYYGNGNGSAQSAVPGSANGLRLSWAISRHEDSVGNPIRFSYVDDINGHRISRIDYAYGANKVATSGSDTYIEFIYQARPDPRTFYLAGYALQRTQRLSLIRSVSGGVELRNYRLQYHNATAIQRQSYLEKLFECVGGNCLAPTTFSWNFPGAGYNNGVTVASIAGPNPAQMRTMDINGDGSADLVFMVNSAPYSMYYQLWNGNGYNAPVALPTGLITDGNANWRILDFNNDGCQDLMVGSPGQSWKLFLGSSAGLVAYNGNADTGIPYVAGSTLVDLNGDGLVDLEYNDINYSQNRYASYRLMQRVNIGGYWNYQFAAPQPFYFSSISVPGVDPTDGIYGFGIAPGEILDYNADGKVDLSAYMSFTIDIPPEAGGGGFYQAWHAIYSANDTGVYDMVSYGDAYDRTYIADELVFNVDINGDGLPDRLAGTPISTKDKAWSYALNVGNNGYTQSVALGNSNSLPGLQPVDFDGDGYSDLIYGSGGVLVVRFFNPLIQGFDNPVTTSIPFQGVNNDQYQFADVDGDGHIDILRINNANPGAAGNSVVLYRSLDAGRAINRITRIDNGMGNVIDITFSGMNESSVYSRATDANAVNWPDGSSKPYTVMDVAPPDYLVARVSSTAPAAGTQPGAVIATATSSVRYHYFGAKLQAGGRGYLGFAKISTLDEQSLVTTITSYAQNFPLTGQPLTTEVKANTGTVMKYSINHPVARAVAGVNGTSYYQVYVDSIAEKNSDPVTGAEIGYVETISSAPDSWGNIGTITTSTYSASSHSIFLTRAITQNTYGGSAYEQQFGRLTRAQVTHQRNCADPCADIVRTSVFTYYDDSAGNLKGLLKTEVMEPDGDNVVTSYFYDAFGNTVRKTVSAGGLPDRSSNTTYDAAGRFAVSTSSPFLVGGSWADQITETVTARNAYGSPTRIEGLNGIVTTIAYDDLGREVGRSDNTGAGLSTSFSRDFLVGGATHKVSTTTTGGASTIEYFDALDRSIAKSHLGFDGSVISTETEYDSAGRIKRQSQPHYNAEPASWVEYQYDTFGRLVAQSIPASHNQTALTSITRDGLHTIITNALGQTREEWRNAAGELLKVRDFVGGSIGYAYDAMGHLIVTTSADQDSPSQIVIYSYVNYDLLGRKVKMVDSDKGTWFYRYNAFGDMTDQYKVISVHNYGGTFAQAQTDGVQMQRTHMDYDRRGRLVTRDEYREGASSWENRTTWAYDTAANGVGELAQESGGGLQRNYSYDSVGRVVGILHQDGNGAYLQTVSYDNVGRVLRKTDALGTGSGLQDSYNSQGYLQAITDIATGTVLYQVQNMSARDQVTTALLGNGATATWNYDARSGLLLNQTVTIGAYALQNLSYAWDVLGNQKSRRDQGLVSVSSNSYRDLQQSFCYDGLNRLIKTHQGSLTGGCSLAPTQQDQQYDAFGNITSKAGIGAYTYMSGRPRTLQATGDGVSYNYDNTGNLISDSNGRALHYTVFDKPDLIVKYNNQVAFSYGPDRDFYKRVDTDTANNQSTTTYTIGDVEKVIKPGGAYDIRRYMAGVALWIYHFSSSGTQTGLEKQYMHKDVLGSVTLITDDVAAIKQQLAFNAWGERVDVADWQSVLPPSIFLPVAAQFTTKGFTGHEMLDTVGLIHMQGRIYDARLGRFVQADPVIQDVTDTQAYNRYAYVRNNPLTLADPTGFSWLGNAWNHVKSTVTKTWHAVLPYVPQIVTAVAAVMCQCYALAAAFNAAWTVGNGGSLQDGAIAGVSTWAFSALPTGPFAGLSPMQIAGRIALSGTVGGVLSMLQGGRFGDGFIAAGLGAGVGGAMAGTSWGGGITPFAIAARIGVGAVTGGTVSALTGGKFANGAVSGAFGAAINEAVSSVHRAFSNEELEESRVISQKKYDDEMREAGVRSKIPSLDEVREIEQIMSSNDFIEKAKGIFFNALNTGEETQMIRVYKNSGPEGSSFYVNDVVTAGRCGNGSSTCMELPKVRSDIGSLKLEWHPHPLGSSYPSAADFIESKRNGVPGAIWYKSGRGIEGIYYQGR